MFEDRNEEFNKTEAGFRKAALQELGDHNLVPPPLQPGVYENLFDQFQFRVRNHMTTCYLYSYQEGQRKPLALNMYKMSRVIPLSYFVPEKGPGLFIFIEDEVCTALLSNTGKITITGGYSEEQLKFCLSHFIFQVILGLTHYYPKEFTDSISFDTIIVKNRLCTNKLFLKAIDVISLSDFFTQRGYNPILRAQVINILYVKPFPQLNDSITIKFFPAGGINITGLCCLWEAEMVIRLICSVLDPFLADLEVKNPASYRKRRLKKETGVVPLSRKRKLKKILKWEALKQECEDGGVYEAWNLKHYPPPPVTFVPEAWTPASTFPPPPPPEDNWWDEEFD